MQSLLAVIDDATGTLSVVDLDGLRRIELKPPRARIDVDKSLWRGFGGCFFGADGDHLWLAARLSPEAIEVQLRETGRWSVVASVAIEDPFGESDCSFVATGRGKTVALWLAAGQDGQRVSWLTNLGGSIVVEPEPFLEDTTSPVFSPNGGEFLVVDGLWSLCKFPFPADRKLGACRSKWGEEDYFAECLCYVDEATALVRTVHGRLLLVDLRAMKIRDELVVRGHEPRPIEAYYPTLVGDTSLCTDIDHFHRSGDFIVFVHQRESGTGMGDWKDTLLIDRADAIARRTESP